MGTAGLPLPQSPPRREWPQAKELYGDSTQPRVCDRLDVEPQGYTSHTSIPTE